MFWNNTEITIEGAATVMACFETVFKVRFGTATYIDVTYHSNLGINPVRYYPDANGESYLPFGDLARVLVDSGVSGAGVVVFEVVDDVDGTPVQVKVNLYAGYVPRSQDGICPPHRFPASGYNMNSMFAFDPVGAWPQSSQIEKSIDGGLTWNIQTIKTVQSDGVVEYYIPTYSYNVGDLYRVMLAGVEMWRCTVTDEECGAKMLVEWLADDQKTRQSWAFEVVDVVRTTTDTQEVDDTTYYGGTFFKTKKNWKLTVKGKVRGLSEQEARYFGNLPNAQITNTTCTEDATLTYIAIWQGQQIAAVCTDKKSERNPNSNERFDLTFTFDLYTFKTF